MCANSLLEDVRKEVTTLLRDLIRIDTTNPPGNETRAAEYVAETLENDGFDCRIYESETGRGSVLTRMEGSGGKPSLLLLSHLDVVAANPKEWSVDPFSGTVKDGFVWGRGAIDMKSMTAAEVMVMKLLRRRHVKLKGDVTLAATADEEKGGEVGLGWLARYHPQEIRADYVLNEGGSPAVPVHHKNVYTIQTAEKGILWFKIKAKGTPGHGSIPGAADNAIVLINKAVSTLLTHRFKIILSPTVKEYFMAVAAEDDSLKRKLTRLPQNPEAADSVLDELSRRDKFLAEEMKVKLRMTMTPTMIHGGVKENIIPSYCEAVFDCRVLPGQTTAEALNTIKKLLKEVDSEKLEYEIIQANEPSESPLHTPLFERIREVLKDFEPNCSIAPDMMTGGTDSRFLRKMGAVCYGFQPMRADMGYGDVKERIHGIDERISVDNLVFGTSVLYNVVKSFMT